MAELRKSDDIAAELGRLRESIDEVDRSILERLNERARLVEEYQEKFANPFVAAEKGYLDEVMLPRLLRRKLVAALSMLHTKRDWMPTKKHGNIPL